MATPSWSISGQYFETCSCDFVCPCITGQMAARPSKGSCTFAMAMQIERGSFGNVPLDGIAFVVLGYTPEEMAKGNWSVGLVIDERANAEQREAVTAIASGAAGGPMAPLSGLIGKFLGAEQAPIRIDRSGLKFAVKAGNLVDMAAEGQKGDRSERDRADVPRQHRPPCLEPPRSRSRVEEPRPRARTRHGTIRAGRTTVTLRRSTGGVPNPVVDERPPTRPRARARDTTAAPLIVLLILFPVVCWAWIVVMARDMYGPMTGASAWMMTPAVGRAPRAAALGDVGRDDGGHDAAVRLADAADVRRRRQAAGFGAPRGARDLRAGGGIRRGLGTLQRGGHGRAADSLHATRRLADDDAHQSSRRRMRCSSSPASTSSRRSSASVCRSASRRWVF